MKNPLLHRFVALLTSVLLVACSGIEVMQTQAPKPRLSQMQTYAWAAPAVTSNELMAAFDKVVRAEVNRELTARGYLQVAREAAEFLVDYRFSEIQNASASVDLEGGYDGWKRTQGGMVFEGGSGQPLHEYPMGVLSLAFFRPDTQDDLWEIYGAKMLDEKRDLDHLQANVRRVVRTLFDNFNARAAH